MKAKALVFVLNDQVMWTSSSAGVRKTKHGRVEAIIPAGGHLTPEQARQADAWGVARKHQSYLVRVPGKTPRAKGTLYWPRVQALARPSPST